MTGNAHQLDLVDYEHELARPITAEDEFVHTPVGPTNWRENWWLTFFDHEQQIRGVVYTNILPGLNHGFVLVQIYQGRQPLFILSDGAVPIGDGDHVAARVGPVQFDCVEPLGQWRIRVDHPDLTLDLTWQAMAAAYDWDWGLTTTSRHFEQPGVVTGSLASGETRLQISGFGQRDRAWGHRDPSIIREAWSSRTFFGEGDMQHATVIRTESETFLFGFVLKDGQSSMIERLDLTITPAYPGGPPLHTALRALCPNGPELTQDVDLDSVIPVIKAGRGSSSNQFFTFSTFSDARARAVGQLDYWWAWPKSEDVTLTCTGNRGRWVTC